MVTVVLKHVHVVRTTLRSGRLAEYHYAWKGKGAPRLQGPPGSPVYVASYEAAHRARKRPGQGTLRGLVVEWKASPEFKLLGAHTLRAYNRHLDAIDIEFGDLPLAALDDPKVRRHFLRWRNGMAEHARSADYAVGTLKRLLKWGVENVHIETNQAAPIGRLHRADKPVSIWTPEDFAVFAQVASPELRWAVELASFTGLRQGDLVRLPWSAFDGTSFQLRTSKRGRRVLIPATPACRALMAEIKAARPKPKAETVADLAQARAREVVLFTLRGKRPWTTDGLRSSFRKACALAKIDRTFHDLRRTAATRLLSAGLDDATVALVMGWAEADVQTLKRLYVSTEAVVTAMLSKLEPK